jgi:tetratricopeptide (TPR) repeat protein
LSGRVAYLARDSELALKECEEAIALEEYFYLGHLFKGHVLCYLREYDKALTAFRRTCELIPDNPVCLSELAQLYALQQRNIESLAIMKQIENARASGRYVSPHVFAHVALARGDHELALDFLDETLAERGAYLIALTTDPIYDSVRTHPRFAALVQKVGFVDESYN